jgi:acetyl-CoA synthetase
MGTEIPGATTTVLARDPSGALRHGPDGSLVPVTDEVGELAIHTGWPGFPTAGADVDESAVVDGWYRTDDLVRRDRDGTYWFVGRSDEVFEAAGRIVGPYEIEAVLDEHQAVIESAVAWLDGGIVAFVVPSATHPASDELRDELLAHARLGLGPDLMPRTIVFVESLPHGDSDKILRHRLAYPTPPTTPETTRRT